MAKSNYPSKLDTSKEIPAVRDNILEIGSETINSIRSAIFNIEKTLGINPQGSSGNTVANRLNAITDGSGKIRKDALTLANVLSGPITNVDVANTAAIAESKLRLNFPTQILQDEISIVGSEIDVLKTQIDDLSASVAAHLHSSAINRHKAAAISVVPTTADPSDTSLIDLEADDVQEALEDLHNRHINYTGSSITETNNSHTADQIYFDDSKVSGSLSADDVQEAIEEAVLLTSIEAILHQDRLHSNGYLRNGFIKDPTNDEVGLILAKDQVVNFAESSGESDGLTRITFDTAIELNGFSLKKGDLIVIEDENDTEELYVGTYEIAAINLSVDELELESVDIFGFLHGSDTATTFVTVAKNPRRKQSIPGLLLATREKATLTSADSIQVANPESTWIISSGIEPSEITSTNRYMTLSVDGGSDITLDMYDASSTVQSIDSISKSINEQAVEGNHSFLAYRVELETGGIEIALVHNLPNTEGAQHTLEVGSGSDDGITAAGFGSYNGIEVSTGVGSLYFINGNPLSGLKTKLNTTGLSFFSGGTSVTIGNSSIDFLQAGIKKGDILIISEATNSDDDGSFVITDVAQQSLTVSSDQLPSGFADEAGDDTTFQVYDSIFNLEDIVFDEVTESLGAALVECYIDEKQSLFYNKRIEYSAVLSGLEPLFVVVDCSHNISDGDELSLVITVDNGIPYISLDGGTSERISGDSFYKWIYSGTKNKKIKLFIADASALESYVTANGTTTVTIYGYDPLNEDSTLLLGRVPFGNFKGRVIGGLGSNNPRIFHDVDRGTVSWDDLGSSAIERGVIVPARELRTGGVVDGLKVTSVTISGGLYIINVDRGTGYVAGQRFVLSAHTSLATDIASASVDKFYIAVSTEGDIVFSSADPVTCQNPFAGSDYITLATVEYDNTTVRVIDLRLFVSDIDLKILNAVTVSPDPRMGHFSSVTDALKYARRFSNLYPEAGTPTIHLKSGTHEVISEKDETSKDFSTWLTDFIADPPSVLVPFYTLIYDEGIMLDFPVNIEGEGDSTVLKVRTQYEFSDQTVDFRGVIVIPGDAFTSISAPNDVFNSGFIKISNMKIDNARVSMIDMNVETGATVHTFGVELDSLIFDLDNFTNNAFDTLIKEVAVELTEEADETEYKGNLVINNCKFIKSFFRVTEDTRVRNIRFSNNVKYGEEEGFLLEQDLLTFDNVPDGANIEIYGNSNFFNSDPIESSGSPLLTTNEKMGTRMESNLYLGGAAEVSDYVSADNYNFNSQQTARRVIHADQLIDTDMGGAPGGMSFGSYDNGTRWVRVITSNPNTSDKCTIRLPEIRDGQELSSLTVVSYVQSPGNESVSYDFNIYSEDVDLDRTVEESGTLTPNFLANGMAVCSKNLSNTITGGDTKYFYVDLTRASVGAGLIQYIAYITYTVKTDTVEGIGGF